MSNGIEAGGRPNPVRKLASVLWVVSIGVVCYLSLQPEVDFPLDFERADLAYHSLTYLWLSFLPFIIFGEKKRQLLAALLMIPLGVALEIGQSFVPGRTFSILDMVANSCGTLFGVICGKYLHGAIHKIMRF